MRLNPNVTLPTTSPFPISSRYGISDPKFCKSPAFDFIPRGGGEKKEKKKSMLPPPPTPNPTTAALYKTNLPTMMPTKKKRMMRAAERALRPSSFFRPAEECWEDMTLLFLIRRPSSS